MSENRSLILTRDDTLYWWQPGTSAPQSLEEESVRADLRSEVAARSHHVAFAVPGADCRLIDLDIAPEERKHLDASLPFMLEEAVAEDIELLHFSRSSLVDGQITVAVTEHRCMQQWQQQLGEFASAVPWLPEALLLPWESGQWVICIDSDSALLRYGRNLGTRIELDLLEPLLSSLASEHAPTEIILFGEDEEADRGRIPRLIEASTQWWRGGFASAIRLSSGDPEIDLRQGKYAEQLPYSRWWGMWRGVAIFLLAAVMLQLVSGWLDYRRLQRENVALRSEIVDVYREISPRGAISDAERQLRTQLAGLAGGAGGVSFTSILEPLAQQVAEIEGVNLVSLNFSRRTSELRVNLIAPDFAAVERLREALVQQSIEASLENSSRNGESVRARLRIGARS